MSEAMNRLLALMDKVNRDKEVKTCKNCGGYEECKRFFSNPDEKVCFIWHKKEE